MQSDYRRLLIMQLWDLISEILPQTLPWCLIHFTFFLSFSSRGLAAASLSRNLKNILSLLLFSRYLGVLQQALWMKMPSFLRGSSFRDATFSLSPLYHLGLREPTFWIPFAGVFPAVPQDLSQTLQDQTLWLSHKLSCGPSHPFHGFNDRFSLRPGVLVLPGLCIQLLPFRCFTYLLNGACAPTKSIIPLHHQACFSSRSLIPDSATTNPQLGTPASQVLPALQSAIVWIHPLLFTCSHAFTWAACMSYLN